MILLSHYMPSRYTLYDIVHILVNKSLFQTNITIFKTNSCEKMSIQNAVLGFEPTAFRT